MTKMKRFITAVFAAFLFMSSIPVHIFADSMIMVQDSNRNHYNPIEALAAIRAMPQVSTIESGEFNINNAAQQIHRLTQAYEIALIAMIRYQSESPGATAEFEEIREELIGVMHSIRNMNASSNPSFTGENAERLTTLYTQFIDHLPLDPDAFPNDVDQAINLLRNQFLPSSMPDLAQSAISIAYHMGRMEGDAVPLIYDSMYGLVGFNDRWGADPNVLYTNHRLNDGPTSSLTAFFGLQAGQNATSEWAHILNQIRRQADDTTTHYVARELRNQDDLLLRNVAHVRLSDNIDEEMIEEIIAAHMTRDLQTVDRLLTNDSLWYPEVLALSGMTNQSSGPALTNFQLAAFAATAVYTPFHSMVGDEEYMDALFYLLGVHNDDLDGQYEVRNTFSRLAQYLKPLYGFLDAETMTRGATHDWGASHDENSGPMVQLDLGSVFHVIETGRTLIGGVLPGVMRNDGNAWVFSHNALQQNSEGDWSVASTVLEGGRYTNTSGLAIQAVLEVNAEYSAGAARLGRDAHYVTTPGSITAGLLTNIYNSWGHRADFHRLLEQPLFLNIFGDIVLADSTIVLPAAANPVYFSTQPVNWSGTEGWWYNPFTVAFYGSYPVFGGDRFSPFIASQSDFDKWMFAFLDSSDLHFPGHSPQDHGGEAFRARASMLPVSASGLRMTARVNYTSLYFWPNFNMVSPNSTQQMVTLTAIGKMDGEVKMYGGLQFQTHETLFGNTRMNIARLLPIRGDGYTILPHFPAEVIGTDMNVDRRATRRIAANMLSYISQVDASGNFINWDNDSAPTGNGLLREAFMFYSVALPVSGGIATPRAFAQNIADQHRIEQGDMGLLEDMIIRSHRFIDSIARNSEGVLGLVNIDDVSGMPQLYLFIHQYWMIVFLVFTVILVTVFLRSKNTKLTLFLGFFLFLGTFLLMYVIPRSLPTLVARPLHFMSQDLVARTVLMDGERYSLVFDDQQSLNMGSIKLYNLSLYQTRDLRAASHRNPNDFMGDFMWLDERVGIYTIGTEIRQDLRRLWQITSIQSHYVERYQSAEHNSPFLIRPLNMYQGDIFSYQILANYEIANAEMMNHYSPFMFMYEGIIYTMNTFLRVYDIPRSLVLFPDGFAKDAYIFPNFVVSLPFLALMPQATTNLASTPQGIVQWNILQQHFPNPGDITRMQWLVETEWIDLPASARETIWGQTMFRNGFFDPAFGRQRRQILVNQTNDAVYRFLIGLRPELGLVSDENILKLASLHATMEFNNHISTMFSQVYPQNLPVSHINASNILTSAHLMESGRFVFYGADLTDNIIHHYGLLGLIPSMIALISLIVLSAINSWGVPILYVGGALFMIIGSLSHWNVKMGVYFFFRMFMSLIGLQVGVILILNMYGVWGIPMHILAVAFLLALLTFFVIVQIMKGVQGAFKVAQNTNSAHQQIKQFRS